MSFASCFPSAPQFLVPATLALAGGFGGALSAIRTPTINQIIVPFTGRKVDLGFAGDILVGIGAGLAIYAFNAVFPSSSADKIRIPDVDVLLRFFGLGLIAGFAGVRILDKMAAELLKQKVNDLETKTAIQLAEVQKQLEIARLLADGREFYYKKLYKSAVETYDKVLALEPRNPKAQVNKAAALNSLDPRNHQAPVQLINAALVIDPKVPFGYYNRACIKALNPDTYTPEEVLADLEKAIADDPSNKVLATDDPDFAAVRNAPRFKDLIK
jgi:tetratricopeptide (TPR) repeat protein